MAGKLGRFQMRSFQYFAGMPKENHLGQLLQSNSQKASGLMVQLLAVQRGKTLETFLSKFPKKEFDEDTEYTWDIVGSSRRNIPLVEARDENGTVITAESDNVGVNGTPFYLVFAENWFFHGEVIVGNYNEVYPIRIVGEPITEGSNTVYLVEPWGSVSNGIPAERLLAGEKFSVEAAYIEKELSRKAGGIRHAAPISMRNEFSRIRIHHKVPGSMLGKKMACGIPVVDNNGNKSVQTMWMTYEDWLLEQQFSDYKNNALMFGRSNRDMNGEYKNIGDSGQAIQAGDGLRAQMEAGNTIYYNNFSIKLIENALYQLSTSKLGLGERTFVIKTGELGAIQFHKAVLDTVSGWTQFTINGDNIGIVSKTQSNLHSNALAAGFQFTEFLAPNGVRVKVDVDPYYDDTVRNKVSYKDGLAESYRYDIFDIGTMDQPNIFLCGIKGKSEYRGYQWGPFANPFTNATDNMFASTDEDSAEFHKKAVLGVCVLDPTRTLSLVPAILQA